MKPIKFILHFIFKIHFYPKGSGDKWNSNDHTYEYQCIFCNKKVRLNYYKHNPGGGPGWHPFGG